MTPEVLALAKARILDGGNLATCADVTRREIKLALILVRVLNPLEELSNAELSILMSVGKNRVPDILTDKHFLQVVNR